MKTTFDRLTVGDIVYVCHVGKMKIHEYPVTQVSNVLRVNCLDIPRLKETETEQVKYSSYSKDEYCKFFCNKPDAIRYAKAQMMKELFSLIDSAKASFQKVKEFKLQNYDLLQHEWTEKQINIMERELNQL